MTKPVRVLLVEDNDLDAAHFTMALKRGGFDPTMHRVETREEMLAALQSEEWDIVVSDYTLPNFSAPAALETLKSSGRDLPFVVVSGAVGEETAVELMRAGASDYLLKHRLTRLTAAIDRELAQAGERRAKRRAEDLFHAVLRASPQAGVVIDRLSRTIVDGSDAFRRSFVRGQPITTLLDAIEFTQPERIDTLLARGSGTIFSTVYYLDGVAHVANVRCHSVDHEGTSYAYVVLDDVTEQNYLKAAFDAVPDPLLIVSSRQTLLYANRPAEEVFGQLYFGSEVSELLSQPQLEPRWWANPTIRNAERRIELRGQPYEASSVPFRFAGETDTSTILTLRNISQEAELLRLATHDALTGIHNVRYFNEVLAKSVDGQAGALALIDLDNFKPINDQLGHAAGDAALITFAHTIRAELRPGDVFARLGGDEFGILFGEPSIDGAKAVMDAVYARLVRVPFRYEDVSRPISASAGLTAPLPADTPESLRKRADEALYEAKRQGKGRYVVA
ncbi:MAG TPA: diguanylate cyclase [Thermoanaerobaculia bacterium]|jgi:diguanylate cyclase (GGDEF)-like protein